MNPPTAQTRFRRLGVKSLLLLIAVLLGMITTSSPASAAINRGTTWTITGTNCSLTVGGWQNTQRYPATASRVTCGSRHTVQVRNQLWYAGTNNVATLFGQSSWYTYSNAYGTPELDTYWATCPGYWDWQSSAQLYIDGVYRGNLGNAWGWWTACT